MNQTGASFNSHNSRLNSPKKLQKSQYYTYSDAYQENINNRFVYYNFNIYLLLLLVLKQKNLILKLIKLNVKRLV